MPIKFTPEVRERAVRLCEEHIAKEKCPVVVACKAIAPKIGVSYHTLRNWVKLSRAEQQPIGEMTREELATEVKQLRTKLVEMQRANEILKAASAFFAAELDRPGPR